MHVHGFIPAAQPHLQPNAFSAKSLSREERNGRGERPSFKGTLAASVKLRFERTSAAETRRSDVGPEGVFRFVFRPLLGVTLRGYPAPCGTALFCFDFVALRVTVSICDGPSANAELGTWEPGPLLGFAGVTRAGYGKINNTEIATMYQNKVTLIGFMGKDAEVRTNDNRSFTTLSLATKSSYKKDGKYISHTEWHRCVVFGKLSEFAGTLKKGAHLQVEGELHSREYETKKDEQPA